MDGCQSALVAADDDDHKCPRRNPARQSIPGEDDQTTHIELRADEKAPVTRLMEMSNLILAGYYDVPFDPLMATQNGDCP